MGTNTAPVAAYYGQLSENAIIVIVAENAKVVIALLCFSVFILHLIVFNKFH